MAGLLLVAVIKGTAECLLSSAKSDSDDCQAENWHCGWCDQTYFPVTDARY